MGEKDITEKILEDHNDVFADIINGLLFDGVQEIKPEALENTTVHAQYKAEDDKVHGDRKEDNSEFVDQKNVFSPILAFSVDFSIHLQPYI